MSKKTNNGTHSKAFEEIIRTPKGAKLYYNLVDVLFLIGSLAVKIYLLKKIKLLKKLSYNPHSLAPPKKRRKLLFVYKYYFSAGFVISFTDHITVVHSFSYAIMYNLALAYY